MASSPRRAAVPAVPTKRISVPGNLALACEQFNAGEFFACHETLEEVWQEEQGDVRDLYKGLIQLAAAFVHVTRGNPAGARRLLTTALGYLGPYREGGAMGFDVEAICAEAALALDELSHAGPPALAYLYPDFVPHFAVSVAALPAEALRWRAWGFDAGGRALEMEVPDLDA